MAAKQLDCSFMAGRLASSRHNRFPQFYNVEKCRSIGSCYLLLPVLTIYLNWKSEVIVMSIFEYDEKREKKKLLQTELPISKEEAKSYFSKVSS